MNKGPIVEVNHELIPCFLVIEESQVTIVNDSPVLRNVIFVEESLQRFFKLVLIGDDSGNNLIIGEIFGSDLNLVLQLDQKLVCFQCRFLIRCDSGVIMK